MLYKKSLVFSEGKDSKSGKTPAPAVVLENLRLTLTDYRKRLDNTSDEVHMSSNMKKQAFGVANRCDTNWLVQFQKKTSSLKFCI